VSIEISKRDALALFQRWKDTSSRLSIGFYISSAIQGQFSGHVAVAQPEMVVLRSSTDRNSHLTLSTQNCRFIFYDVKGDPDSFADAETPLHILFPNGEKCLVVAFKVVN